MRGWDFVFLIGIVSVLGLGLWAAAKNASKAAKDFDTVPRQVPVATRVMEVDGHRFAVFTTSSGVAAVEIKPNDQ